MSYDLVCYRERPDESPEQAMERLEELAEIDTAPGDAAWAEIARIGDQLTALDVGAERHGDRPSGFVQVTTDRFQVSVYEHEAALTMPYWSDESDESDGSEEPWTAIADHLGVLRRAGFTIYDPQTEELVGDDLAAEVAGGYRASAASARQALDESRADHSEQRQQRRWPFGRRKKDD